MIELSSKKIKKPIIKTIDLNKLRNEKIQHKGKKNVTERLEHMNKMINVAAEKHLTGTTKNNKKRMTQDILDSLNHKR